MRIFQRVKPSKETLAHRVQPYRSKCRWCQIPITELDAWELVENGQRTLLCVLCAKSASRPKEKEPAPELRPDWSLWEAGGW